MTEQELREDFFARTGRVATKDIGAYAAFCEGVKCGFREGYEKGASAFHDAVKTEREACAKVCEGTMDEAVLGGSDDYNTGREMGATVCANRIRMRSNAALRGAEGVPLESTVRTQEAE